MIIIRRGDLYLSTRYEWGIIPAVFPDWHLDAIVNCMGAVQVAQVTAGVIDLDALEYVNIGS